VTAELERQRIEIEVKERVAGEVEKYKVDREVESIWNPWG
jgi:hypothetical protein